MYYEGHGEVIIDIMLWLLLTTAEPGHLHYDTDYFISLVFFDSDEERKLLQVKDYLKWVWMLPYLPLPLLGTVNFCDSWLLYCVEPTYCWINHGEAHEINACLSLPLRVYFLMRCTHNAFGESLWTALIVHYHILAVSCFFGKICKIWCYWMVCAYLFSTSRILLSLWHLSG